HLTYPVNAGVFGDKGNRPNGSFNGGNYLRDVVFLPAGISTVTPIRIVEFKLNSAASNLSLTWEGDGPLFQVEKAATVCGPYQPVGAAQAPRTYTDAAALQAGTRAFYRVRTANQ